jgi:hypothetical protein
MQGVPELVPSVLLGALSILSAFLSTKCSAAFSPSQPSELYIPTLFLYFGKTNALAYALTRGPSQREKTCPRTMTCAPVCHLAEYSSDPLNGAIIAYHDRKHSPDAVEPRSMRRNENQLYSSTESAQTRTYRER